MLFKKAESFTPLLCFALLCSAFLSFSFLFFSLLCFNMPCLLCFALLCFTLLCFSFPFFSFLCFAKHLLYMNITHKILQKLKKILFTKHLISPLSIFISAISTASVHPSGMAKAGKPEMLKCPYCSLFPRLVHCNQAVTRGHSSGWKYWTLSAIKLIVLAIFLSIRLGESRTEVHEVQSMLFRTSNPLSHWTYNNWNKHLCIMSFLILH